MSVDTKKVIKGLEWCLFKTGCNGCPYRNDCDDGTNMEKDALALLKAQEPRVMTLEEVRELAGNNEIVWAECKGTDDCCDGYCSPDLYFRDGETIILWQPGNECEYAPKNADYGLTWRCWTSRPDEIRRAETPWE